MSLSRKRVDNVLEFEEMDASARELRMYMIGRYQFVRSMRHRGSGCGIICDCDGACWDKEYM